MKPNYQIKIVVLWAVFLLGTLFHVQLGLMPLFHDLSVTVAPAANLDAIMPVFWGMLAFFGLPMITMILTVFTDSKAYRRSHFVLTVIYTIFNVAHVLADLLVPPRVWPQITLMIGLFGVGLLLNRVAWQWWHQRHIWIDQEFSV